MADTFVVDLADRAELMALRHRRRRASWSQVRSLLPVGDDPAAEDDADPESESELLLSSVRSELRRREAVDDYPFEVRTGALEAVAPGHEQDLWEFLVTLSVHSHTRVLTGHKPSLLFERLCRDALAAYTSGHAHVLSDLDNRIRPAISKLGELLQVQAFPLNARLARKDHGLDVIAWRAFRNMPYGFPTVLCQCTVRKHDLVAKACETRAEDWNRLLHVNPKSFTTAFAVPHVVPPEWDHWFELLTATELVLDRLRLWDLLTPQHKTAAATAPEFAPALAAMRAAKPPVKESKRSGAAA